MSSFPPSNAWRTATSPTPRRFVLCGLHTRWSRNDSPRYEDPATSFHLGWRDRPCGEKLDSVLEKVYTTAMRRVSENVSLLRLVRTVGEKKEWVMPAFAFYASSEEEQAHLRRESQRCVELLRGCQ